MTEDAGKANKEINESLRRTTTVPETTEQPNENKYNPGPLENLIIAGIEHELECIAANLEMLKPKTKEQKCAKCVLALEIARITGEGGIYDNLREAFE